MLERYAKSLLPSRTTHPTNTAAAELYARADVHGTTALCP